MLLGVLEVGTLSSPIDAETVARYACCRSILSADCFSFHSSPLESVRTINALPHLEADGASNHISARYLTESNLIKATQCKSQIELSQSDGGAAGVQGVTGQLLDGFASTSHPEDRRMLTGRTLLDIQQGEYFSSSCTSIISTSSGFQN